MEAQNLLMGQIVDQNSELMDRSDPEDPEDKPKSAYLD